MKQMKNAHKFVIDICIISDGDCIILDLGEMG
jgi:hypothetical protein